jgi:hypothetical protein
MVAAVVVVGVRVRVVVVGDAVGWVVVGGGWWWPSGPRFFVLLLKVFRLSLVYSNSAAGMRQRRGRAEWKA